MHFYAFTAGFKLSELETFTKIFIAYFRETITLIYAVIINSRRIMVCKYSSYQLSYVTCFLFNRAISLLILRLNCIILEQYTDLVVKRTYQENNSTYNDPFPPYIIIFFCSHYLFMLFTIYNIYIYLSMSPKYIHILFSPNIYIYIYGPTYNTCMCVRLVLIYTFINKVPITICMFFIYNAGRRLQYHRRL